jgi:ferredoxin
MEDRDAPARARRAAGRVVSPGWRVTVDPERCSGSGVCAATAPGHFRVVDGRSRAAAELADPADVVLAAAESCPMEAITIRDAETGQTLAPEP